MRTDSSSMLRLGGLGANLILILIIGTQFIFALFSLAAVKSPWPVLLGLALFVPAALLMARPHTDPFPLRWTTVVVGIGALITIVVELNLPDAGWPGYATWNFGAVTWLLFFLAFRGRIGAAWIGLALMAAITLGWSTAVGRGPLGGLDLVVRHAGTLLMGTLFSLLLRRATSRIRALQAASLDEAATEASAAAEIVERAEQAAQLNAEARPQLERIASGMVQDAGQRRGFELLEASLRDTLRGGALVSPEVAAAATGARSRGAIVDLLDDRNAPLDDRTAREVNRALLDQLRSISTGRLTARLLPDGRDDAATILRDDDMRRRIRIPHAPGTVHGHHSP